MSLQSIKPLTSRTTCSTDMHTWPLGLPVGWLDWPQAWPSALWVMLVSGERRLLRLMSLFDVPQWFICKDDVVAHLVAVVLGQAVSNAKDVSLSKFVGLTVS